VDFPDRKTITCKGKEKGKLFLPTWKNNMMNGNMTGLRIFVLMHVLTLVVL